MILTGREIKKNYRNGSIVITPFNEVNLEPNSYKFHLGDTISPYNCELIDAYNLDKRRKVEKIKIPEEGYVLHPRKFYLGCTFESMGSHLHACELYARFSTGSAGIFIQTSAPLGHTGAIIPWTLEIVVLQSIRIYVGMPIGKICFWKNFGEPDVYTGRYSNSKTMLYSLLTRNNP